MKKNFLFIVLLALSAPLFSAEITEETMVIDQPSRYEQARDYVISKITQFKDYLKKRGISNTEKAVIAVALVYLYGVLRTIQKRPTGIIAPHEQSSVLAPTTAFMQPIRDANAISAWATKQLSKK